MVRGKKNQKQLSLELALDDVEEPSGYTTKQVARITGLSLRQVDTWTTLGIVFPSINNEKGSGTTRYYSYRDILELNVAKKLKDQGQSMDRILDNFSYVRNDLKASVYDSILICVDNQPAVITDEESMITLASGITKTGKGQGILNLNILNLSKVKQEVDDQMDDLEIAQQIDSQEIV